MIMYLEGVTDSGQKLVIRQDSYAGSRQGLGNVQTSVVGFDGRRSLCESGCVVSTIFDGWDC
jgi:hypothetical protein